MDTVTPPHSSVHPLGFNLVTFDSESVQNEIWSGLPYLEFEDLPRTTTPVNSEAPSPLVQEAEECDQDEPSPVKMWVKDRVGSGGPLTAFLSPLEAALVDDNSTGFNTSRIHEAPTVPNELRVAIQHLDYLTERNHVVAHLRTIEQSLDRTLAIRSDEYFLAFGQYFGVKVKGKKAIALRPPVKFVGQVDFRAGYPTIQYLVPTRFPPLQNPEGLRGLLRDETVPRRLTREVLTGLKNAMYLFAATDPPSPISSNLTLLASYNGQVVRTAQIESASQHIIPGIDNPPLTVIPDHPDFREHGYNVVVFPSDKF